MRVLLVIIAVAALAIAGYLGAHRVQVARDASCAAGIEWKCD